MVAAAVGVSVWRIPDAARDAQRDVDRVAGLGRLDRGLAAGREFDLETDTYVAAAQLIPPGATYYVATGTKGLNFSDPAHGQLALFVAVDQMAADVDAEVRAFSQDRQTFVDRLRGSDHPAGSG